MDKYHITKTDDNWKLTKVGNERATLTGETKTETIEKMRGFMKDKVGSVVIHKENGQIQEERTYQRENDPTKSKG